MGHTSAPHHCSHKRFFLLALLCLERSMFGKSKTLWAKKYINRYTPESKMFPSLLRSENQQQHHQTSCRAHALGLSDLSIGFYRMKLSSGSAFHPATFFSHRSAQLPAADFQQSFARAEFHAAQTQSLRWNLFEESFNRIKLLIKITGNHSSETSLCHEVSEILKGQCVTIKSSQSL